MLPNILRTWSSQRGSLYLRLPKHSQELPIAIKSKISSGCPQHEQTVVGSWAGRVKVLNTKPARPSAVYAVPCLAIQVEALHSGTTWPRGGLLHRSVATIQGQRCGLERTLFAGSWLKDKPQSEPALSSETKMAQPTM